MSGGAPQLKLHFERARKTMQEANVLAREGLWQGCVNRLYYTVFYCVEALLLAKGFSSKIHTGMRTLLGQEFVHTGLVPSETAEVFNRLFILRNDTDYDIRTEPDPEEVQVLILRAERFITDIEKAVLAIQKGTSDKV